MAMVVRIRIKLGILVKSAHARHGKRFMKRSHGPLNKMVGMEKLHQDIRVQNKLNKFVGLKSFSIFVVY